MKEPQEGVSVRNAVVTDTLPEGIEYVDGSVTTSGDAATADVHEGTLTVSIPDLCSETVIQFKAKVNLVNGTAKNIAVLSGDKIREVRDEADITVKEPNPTLEKSVSKTAVKVGDTVTYTLMASSSVPMINAKIVDTPPAGVEIVSGSETCSMQAKTLSVSGNVLTAEFDSLKDPVTITYEAKIKEKGEFANVATLTADNFPKGPLQAEATITAKAPAGKTTSDNRGTLGRIN